MTVIVTKNSSTASSVPTAADLVQGELAVNVADKRLFTEDNAAAIIEIGTNPTSITTGAITASGTVTFSVSVTNIAGKTTSNTFTTGTIMKIDSAVTTLPENTDPNDNSAKRQ